jgi:membrane protease YdiL (CAAX protease family)
MISSLRTPLLGVATAVVITAVMDATGLTLFSTLPLIPLTLIIWWRQGFSRREMGLTWGRPEGYRLALFYPFAVPFSMVFAAFLAVAIETRDTDWAQAGIEFALMGSLGILMVLLTEEGFFRGWLWAACARAGLGDRGVLVATSVFFTVWHISAVTLTDEFKLPPAEMPIYLANVFLIGMNWGMIRLYTGSLIVVSVSHAVWNAVVYTMFGFGEHVGAMGISATHLFGPEVGLWGVAANVLFAAWLWRRVRPAA